ncbi:MULTISPECIES: CpaF family protein [Nocardiaceae]|jgi:pilus assembly protein CpaF|uniref:CpaF family protein n=1 Tax=Nocardiaceae TaxID=85025 RepID=UPI0002ACC706|nr:MULTISPECIES: CpaF/VirB11 family protein [Rhodococcus]MCZ4278544.1 CpaF/VirB11 family protein [Rhodococcus yunnanensis]CCQ18388.1 putative type II/IV-secretion NTPase [Rhodococcus sp. AW25M09]
MTNNAPDFDDDERPALPDLPMFAADPVILGDGDNEITRYRSGQYGSPSAGLLAAAGKDGRHSHPEPEHLETVPFTSPSPFQADRSDVAKTDHQLVKQLTKEASEILSLRKTQRADQALNPELGVTAMTPDEERESGRQIVIDLVSKEVQSAIDTGHKQLSVQEEQTLVKAVFDTLFGLGPLQPLVDDPNVENILINGDSVIVMYPDGSLQTRPPIADSDEELYDWLTNLAQRAPGGGRPFSQVNPNLRLNLPGDIRLSAMGYSVRHPSIAIRMHRHKDVTIDKMVDMGVMPQLLSEILSAAVIGGASVVISGPMGSGKTTNLRALANCLPLQTRIGTAETEYELFLDKLDGRRPYVVAAEAITGGGERNELTGALRGATTLSDILYQFVRMQLDRVIVGEVAGGEIIDMFKAMQMAKGSLSTTHAEHAAGAIDRLVTCALEAGVPVEYAYRQVAHHINLIIQLQTDYEFTDTGERRQVRFVSEVIHIEAGENAMPAVTKIYEGRPGGTGEYGTLPPALLRKLYAGGFTPSQIPINTITGGER